MHILNFSILYVYYALYWIQCGFIRFVNHCVLLSFITHFRIGNCDCSVVSAGFIILTLQV